MTKHQLRLLLCAGGALALMIASMFFVEWFRVSITGLDALGVNSFKLDLRSATVCAPNGTCASVSLSQVQGFYPTIAMFAFYGSIVLALVVVFQAGSRLTNNVPGEGITRLGYVLAVGCFLASAAAGYVFQPETNAGTVDSIGLVSVSVTRSWAPAMMLVADILAIAALFYASAEESFDTVSTGDAKRLPVTPVRTRAPTMPPAPYKPVRPSALPFDSLPLDGRKPSSPAIDRRLSANEPATEGAPASEAAAPAKSRAVSSIPLDERLSANEPPDSTTATKPDFPVIARTTSSMDTAPDAFARTFAVPRTISAIDTAPDALGATVALDAREVRTSAVDDFELPLPPVKRSAAPTPFMTASDLLAPSVAAATPEPATRAKLSFATTTVAVSSDGIDATCEDHATRVVAWRDVVGVVARRLPPDAPYNGETFVDLVSTSGSTVRILPWTELTGDQLLVSGAGPIERARAFVQLVASRCPEAKLDGATRTFLGSRGLAAQLPDAAMLAQHDERLS